MKKFAAWERSFESCFLLVLSFVLMLGFSNGAIAQPADDETTLEESDTTLKVVEIEELEAPPSEEEALRIAESQDSLYRAWMEVDYDGVRSYWFRKKFEILDPPAGGKIYITADDNWSLYVNGQYIEADDVDEIDWQEVSEINISDFLVIGENIVAIQIDDVDDSRFGLQVAIEYNTIPEIGTQLERMIERELTGQEERRAESLRREEAEKALRAIQLEPPTEQQLRDMRSIEKNKLD